ncbi:MAG: hypothetical protein UU12_C0040G0013 [Candidatus Woesebacteria bacterium GW2011_GWA2_40_7b]|uniref:Fimbrial assembly family protein n=1 Tax=Candidatus Woesebacteria bacterium GW2011_GWA2_40_7b TaxID=1618563 RepID=A0A0G0VC69_9BACT|nr:MAG: hypothetical protein UU12_C0040G0013 [Candidatus Woesebacteria bacterium GW2011_GWA2_40_7b]
MATKINLLPPGFGVTGNLGKILKAVRMVGVIGLAFFLVFGLGISIYFIVSTITFNALKSETNSLKEQVKTLQTTEQQIVLLKDRIGKINMALGLPEAIKNLIAIEPFISNLSSSASLNQLEIDAQKIDLSFQFRSTADTSAFIKSLSDMKDFRSVVLTSFGYDSTNGYTVGISITK